MADFCHLHTHTQFSLLDGAAGIDRLVRSAKRREIPALAITDHGNLFGVPEFHTKARREGIQPIIGCEFYLTPSGIEDKSDKTRYHQVLLAKNERGYRNLMKLSSTSYLEGYYYKPRVDRDILKERHEGLVATTCCLQGEVPQTILHQGEERARTLFEEYLEIFGKDYYIELQDHDLEDQHRVNEVLLRWAKEYDVEVMATNDVHYVDEDDADAQDILLCLQTGKDLDDPNRLRFDNDQFYLKSQQEMQAALSDLPGSYARRAIENTRRIAEECTFELPMGDLLMPHYEIPDEYGEDMDAYLRDLVFEGAKERYGELTESIRRRLDHELQIIGEMDYSGYFLIVQDFTSAAREMDVRVGPGRGSAAGSAVSYCLGITNVDPIKYDLLFERFLNPERVSMPDIDIDFDDRGRSKVIDYVVEKYGREKVCQIITFGSMGARSVIRDVARVLNIPLQEADRIAKLIPDGPGVSLDDAFEKVDELEALKDHEDDEIQKLMHYAQVLEGSPRHTGVHAAGVVIAPDDVTDYVPVAVAKRKSEDERVVTTQYDGDWIEKFGLLKMDFLGLKTLTLLDDTIDLVEETRGEEIDLDAIPKDDEKTFELFQRGDTTSIFQFESDGMRKYLKELEPTSIDDLIAMNALYRPGPLQYIPNYIDRKHGREEVDYPHPMLEEILEPTYGIPVYQEQIMQMAQKMAGYSLGQADILRRAMGKKKEKEMKKQRDVFVEGARENGVAEEKAHEIFDVMAEFAKYGFNKSHSAAYAYVAYQTAYLKAHYPAEFMAAALTSEMNNTEKLAEVLEEAKRQQFRILPPSISESHVHFAVEDGDIRFGLGAIKGVGTSAIESLLEARRSEGPFDTLSELCENLDLRSVNKKTLECLAEAGALDDLEGHRAQFVEAMDEVVRHAQKIQADRAQGQNSLFGDAGEQNALAEPSLPSVDRWSKSQILKKERERTGFYVSAHPLDDFRAEVEAMSTIEIADADEVEEGEIHRVCGIITEINRRTTRNGKPMAFVSLEDFSGQAEIVCFSRVLDRYQNYLEIDEVVMVRGETDKRGNQLNLKAREIAPMWKVREEYVKGVVLAIDPETTPVEHVDRLYELCSENEGSATLYFDLRPPALGRSVRIRSREVVVEPTPSLLRGCARLFGPENVELETSERLEKNGGNGRSGNGGYRGNGR